MINYFNFKKIKDKYLLTNDLGRYAFVSEKDFFALIQNRVDYDSEYGKILKDNFFCFDGSKQAFSEYVKPYMRDSKSYLFSSTSLHIFVVTNSCNVQCRYCQAQNGSYIPNGMMSKDVAKKSVDIALSSPEKYLTFEFQGGEPLLNFEIIKFIVEYSKQNNTDKNIEYNIVSNLTLIDDEIIKYIKENSIGISTSLDGPKELHNINRPYRTKNGTFDDVLIGMNKLKNANVHFGAIQTTTRSSLKFSKEIVETYHSLGLNNLFVRPLTPLGCANKDWEEIGYTPEEFLEFYKNCFDYIIELNKNNYYIVEGHASILLSKILTGTPVNYMELRSPCGASIGQMAYYYDGNIYTCDEGRMLAEMGNDSFKLGNVFKDTYDDLMNCDNCKAACIASTLESIPSCSDCVYNPYCGTCPVVNLALNNNIFSKEPNDYRCKIYKGMLDIIFEAIQDDSKLQILKTWL